MSEIQMFNNVEFGQVRRMTDENSVRWIMGKDICNALGDKNSQRTLSRIDDTDKRTFEIIDSMGRKQNAVFVNESGFYALLFAMQPQKSHNKDGASDEYPIETQRRIERIRSFKKWVTSEVLPSIRKHGAYIVGQESMTREQLIAKALVAANDIIDEKDRQISQLTETNQIQAGQIAELKPRANYCDIVLATKDLVPITLIAKDYGMSATEMNKILHEHGYQYKRNKTWVLYDKYADKGYTSSKTHVYEDCYGREHSQMSTQWTQSGRLFIYNELKKYGILPTVEQRLI